MSKPEEPVAIDGRKQLFIDDWIIEERYNVAKVVNQATKHEENPIIVADEPWELGDLGGYIESCFVHYDDEEQLYKLWYMEFPTSRAKAEGDLAGKSEQEVAEQAPIELRTNHCLAVSRDLVHWEKPSLGIVEYEGSRDNNLFEHHGCLMIFQDPNESDPERRYKGIIRDEKRWCYVPEYSSDGLHWTADYDHPLPHTIRDDAIAPYYDKHLVNDQLHNKRSMELMETPGGKEKLPIAITEEFMGKYVWTRRVWDKGTGGWGGRRVVGISRSGQFTPGASNLENWCPIEHVIIRPDERDDERAKALGAHHAELYEFRCWPYEGIWVGFLHVFYVLVADGAKAGGWPGMIEMQLVTSRDGYYWERAFDRTPVIANGGPGEWDSGMVYRTAAPNIVGDEIWIHYNGFRDRHGPPYNWPGGRTSGIGLAKLRLDGFVSLDASEQGGFFTTKPFRFCGDLLVINADAAGGELAVEVRDAGDNPIAGYALSDCDPFAGDAVRHTVRWNGSPDVGKLAGGDIRLHFAMKGARLYAFQFVETP